jgi:hypothetical protein
MNGDVVAIGILVVLGAGFLSLVPAFLVAAFGTKGTKFQPLPVWPLNLLLPLLALVSLWSGLGQGHWFTFGFMGLAVGVLALQYLIPKRLVDGKVYGVVYTPLALKSVDRTGGKTVLVLALGYKLSVPPLPANRALLEQLKPDESHG